VIDGGEVIYESPQEKFRDFTDSFSGSSGKVDYEITSGRVDEETGEIHSAAAITVNGLSYATADRGLHFAVFQKSTGDLLDECWLNIFSRALKPESSGTPRQLFRIGATPGIRSRIRRIRTELANTDQCTPVVLQSLVQILLTDFCRQLDCETRKKLAGDQIAEINQYLQDHFREKITLQTLASHTGLSPNYLADKYKREMDCTIGWALRKIRISHAEKLLQEGILPHRQIRELCGFPDSSSFYRTFRKLKGVTPEEWAAASKEST
jgi:AraC-like DNA-binding protein